MAWTSSNDEDEEVPEYKPRKIVPRRQTLFRSILVVSVIAVMYLGASGFRLLLPRFRTTKVNTQCHRNLSTVLHQLPLHHTLPSGDRIPAVALGVWQAAPGEVGQAVTTALEAGYKHIDGAWIYGNEREVGQAIKASGIQRQDLWITSKLWNNFHAPEDVEPSLDETLSKLGTSYLDLYLIHWPIAFKRTTPTVLDKDLTENPYPTWKKLEELVHKGKIRNIGVSNFNIRRLNNLTGNKLEIKPAINQVELNFWNPQPELVKWAKENEILLEAYSPLGSDKQVKESLNVPEVKAVAEELCITPAQVLLSWQAQRGNVVLPKSVTASRIQENLHIVRLPDEHFEKIENAATAHPQQRVVDPSGRWGLDIFEDGK